MEGKLPTAILLGEQSLLIQCAEILIKNGWIVSAVVSQNKAVSDWSEENNIAGFDTFQALHGEFSAGSVDCVFSITNLKLLPEWVVSLGKQAINFHDGPLPRYAGLNAPVWALLNDEAEHGVTWHEMTEQVDEGRILAQQKFPIVPGETALSINAKCYQAAIDSFDGLVTNLNAGKAAPVPQDLSERSYYGLTKRPDGAGLIDWNQSVESIDRLVRALDHGAYANPLTSPKMLVGGVPLAVLEAKIYSRDSEHAAGEVVGISKDYFRVACGGGVLDITKIADLSGSQYSCLEQFSKAHGVVLGAKLETGGDGALRSLLAHRVTDVCRYEDEWVSYLLNAEAVTIPYDSNADALAKATFWEEQEFPLPASVLSDSIYLQNKPAFLLALASLLFARLNSKTDYSFAVMAPEPDETKSFFEPFLPLPVSVDETLPFEALLKASVSAANRMKKMGGLASDVWLRRPELQGHGQLQKFSIKLLMEGSIESTALSFDDDSALYISIQEVNGALKLYYNRAKVSPDVMATLSDQLAAIATTVVKEPSLAVGDISILTAQDLQSFALWNQTERPYAKESCLHQLIEEQSKASPDSCALVFENENVTYQELNSQANQLGRYLIEQGAQPGSMIGVMLDRSISMMVSLIAIHKAGCAYVPLDPVYPSDRLAYMVEDSGLKLLISQAEHSDMLDVGAANIIVLDEISTPLGQLSSDDINVATTSSDLAYVIYTSGSTGKPKGVMVEHRNVANFFAGMDSCIGTDPGTWLAVTSISFDISVLELFWTLSRGFKVVLYSDKSAYGGAEVDTTSDVRISKPMDFSLFYWNVATEESHHLPDKYKLLIEGAKFADNNGFKAVWNPERHFASFGGLFPNPSVTCAALATVTTNVDLRAGSCVVPLHSPIRVAEEWAVVDNLSNGRVGIAVASGWAPPDFAIKPENFKESKSIMFDSLDKVRRLWRGETLTFDGPTGEVEVRTLPRPIQKELPYWVTTAGNVETFRSAAEAGANVLTHLLGQTFEEVKEKVDAYRSAWKEAGHEGEGTITLMLHTLIGNDMDEVEDIVRQPMKEYLRSAMFLVKGAAWNFPTFKKMSEETGKSLDEFFETISDEDMDDLLEFAFQRYFRTSGLFGTPDSAVETVAKCDEIGVDEIACLIDFGIDTDVVMQQLPFLEMLKSKCAKLTSIPLGAASDEGAEEDFTIPALIEKHNVTHFQCTPSMATMLVSDPESKKSLGQLKHMMVGGEALTPALAESLLTAVNDRVTNMYGPTETTIWSSTSDVKLNQAVTIGTAIANTQIYIVDNNLKTLPAGVAGELVIGGDGVVRGYYNRPELTSERFVEDFKLTPSSAAQRVYRTGDLARFDSDGQLACLGRIDHQVKIRGYRIELGEIEALLQAHDSVRECAVILREDKAGDKRLVAYARPGFQQHLDVGVLKSSLSEQLPDFMVPSVFVELTEMPLTPNGKVDRNALPEPIQQKHTQGGEFALPENEWEDLIADIWKRALGVPEVGRKDNFFDIGGHSLLVIQVLKDLRDSDKVSRQVQMTDLFRHTTVEALAKFVASGGDESVEAVSEVASSRVAARKAAMNRRRRR